MDELRIGCLEYMNFVNFCQNATNVCLDCIKKKHTPMGIDLDIIHHVIKYFIGSTNITNVSMLRYESFGGPSNLSDPESQWDGLLGALINNDIDIVIPAIFVLPSRYEKINYLFPHVKYLTDSFLVNPAKKGPVSLPKLFQVFNGEIWLLGFITMIVVSTGIFLATYNDWNVSSSDATDSHWRKFNSNAQKYCDCLYGLMFEQRLTKRWSEIRQHLFLVTLWSACAIIGLRFFKAMYVKGLTPKPAQLPFETIDELGALAKAQKYELIFLNNSGVLERLKPDSDYEPWAKLRDSINTVPPKFVQNFSAGLQLVMETSGSAYYNLNIPTLKLVKDTPLVSITDKEYPQNTVYSYGARKELTYAEALATAFMTIKESGITDRINKNYGYLSQEDKDSENRLIYKLVTHEQKPLAFSQINEGLWVLMYGNIFAVIAFGLEMILGRKYIGALWGNTQPITP